MKWESAGHGVPKREGPGKVLLALYAGVTLLAFNGCRASEPPRGCFHSIAEAAAQTRALDPANVGPENVGFRLEDLRRDRLLNKRWALVRSCDHPERPLTSVEMSGDGVSAPAANGAAVAAAYAAPAVRAGARVRVVGTDANVRFETTGIAQSNGALGQSIQVRLDGATGFDGSPARLLTGTVRSAAVVEWEP